MTIHIQVDESFTDAVAPALIEQALKITLQQFNRPPNTSVNVVIADSETVQQLNAQFRGVNALTDVLSFENTADPEFPGLEQNHLGDIIVAYPAARSQAEAAGHRPMDEVILLVVHGALHLLGLDHNTPTRKTQMWAVQRQILDRLGLEHVQPTET